MVRVHSQIPVFLFRRGKITHLSSFRSPETAVINNAMGVKMGFFVCFCVFEQKRQKRFFFQKNIQARNLLQNEETMNKPRWTTNKFLCENGIGKLSAGLNF
jgi:hypothetical protein